jgi:hypothetical protein
MFECSVSKDMREKKGKKRKKKKNNDKRRIPTYLLAYLLTSFVKELKISVEQGRVVTTLSIITH